MLVKERQKSHPWDLNPSEIFDPDCAWCCGGPPGPQPPLEGTTVPGSALATPCLAATTTRLPTMALAVPVALRGHLHLGFYVLCMGEKWRRSRFSLWQGGLPSEQRVTLSLHLYMPSGNVGAC